MLSVPRRVLVLASTFPAERDAEVPAFVRDLVIAMKRAHQSTAFAVLAPQRRAALPAVCDHAEFTEFRFRYAWPKQLEQLTDHGILPTLGQRPWLLPTVPLFAIGLRRALRRLIAEWRPDLIHAHWFTPQGIVAVREGARAGIPVVITSHASDVRIWRSVPGIGSWVVRRHLPRAAAFTAVSERTLGFAAAFFGSSEWETIVSRTSVIPMGVPPIPSVSPATNEGAAPHLLFLGRLAEKKGVSDLIAAIGILDDTRVRLTIAGDGPMRASLERQVARAGLQSRVDFLGHVAGDAKWSALARAQALVLPSVDTSGGDVEGLPVVLLEGLAAGVPCVATTASGAASIIEHGRSGWLVPQRDPDALACALREVLGLALDRRAAVVAAGRRVAESFAVDRIAARYWDVLCHAAGA